MSEELIRQVVRESLLLERTSSTPSGTKQSRDFVIAALQTADPAIVPQNRQSSSLKSGSVRISGTEEAIRSAIDSSSSLRFVDEHAPGKQGLDGKRLSGEYTSFEVSGIGGGPEVYYIVAVTAKKKDDPDLLTGQMLCIMAEYATIEGINGGGSQLQAALADSLVKDKYAALDAAGQEMANQIYTAMVTAAAAGASSMPSGNAVAGNVTSGEDEGTTQAAVDVMIESGGATVADVHVKFNDDDRIIGLQMEPHEKVRMLASQLAKPVPESTWPFAAKYRHLREKFISDVLLPEYDIKPEPGRATYQAYKEGVELDMFNDPVMRRKWLDYADGQSVTNKAGETVSPPAGHVPLKQMIKDRVTRFLSEKNLDKSIYFFNFRTSPSKPRSTREAKVSLVVKEITGLSEEITVEEVPNDLTTFPYAVMYNGVPVFRVETRTRGKENHPPQLKSKIPASVEAAFKAAGAASDSEINSAAKDAVKTVADDVAGDLPGGAEVAIDTEDENIEKTLKSMTTEVGTFDGGTVAATKQNIEETLLREFIREALLTEAFTKTDEKAIEVMARKQIDKKWKEHEKKIDKMFDERDKTLFRNDAFYKVIARIYQELQRAYAEDQFKYATRYTRKDIPLARFRPS